MDCGSCSGEASSSSALPVDTLYICTEFHVVWSVWSGINLRITTRKTSKMRSGGAYPKHLRPVSQAKHALQGNIVRITRIPDHVLVLAHGPTCGPTPKHGSWPHNLRILGWEHHTSPQSIDHTIIERNACIITNLGRRDLRPYPKDGPRRPLRASLHVPRRRWCLPSIQAPTHSLHAGSCICGETRAMRRQTTPPA